MEAEEFDPPRASVGGLDLGEGGPVTCFDLHIVRSASGLQIDGIIGMSFLKRYVVQVDRDLGKVVFLNPDSKHHSEWGAAIPLVNKRSEIPQVMVEFEGSGYMRCIVDTGMSGTGLLPPSLYDRLHENGAATRTVEAVTFGPAGYSVSRSTRIRSMSVGPFRYHDLVMGVDPGEIVVLGSYLLSRHVVTFDFPNRQMYLKKGGDFDRRDETDMSGLVLLRVVKDVTVFAIRKGSPAKEAGIRVGDVILEVGGRSAGELELAEITDLLRSTDGKEIRMIVRRGKKVLGVAFRLRRRL